MRYQHSVKQVISILDASELDVSEFKTPETYVCKDYDGVPDPTLQKCCPSKCGDLCGTENCKKIPGESKECCFVDISDNVVCGVDGEKAPCSLGKR